jgi:exodeoxyribonuclease VII large subunit
MPSPASYTLLELNQYIRRVIALNFDQPVWIEAEISQAGTSRGHWYIDLIQKADDQIVAQCQAALWANVYQFLKRKSPVAPEDLLRPGLAVKLKVNVDYHERYGFKLIIEDIDPAFTIGQLAIQREAVLQALSRKGLLDKNKRLPLPSVIQRLAVISSSRAAGWIDFSEHLAGNRYGYAIGHVLFESAMQGQAVERDMLAAFDQIEMRKDAFDAVAILRGGGGRTDLSVFDNLAVAERLAGFPLPVLVGIGHEIDQSILDIVAHASLKTPTALADFIIEHNLAFDMRLERLSRVIRQVAEARITGEKRQLQALATNLRYAVHQSVWNRQLRLEQLRAGLAHGRDSALRQATHRLERLTEVLDALDPDKVLARGYTITSADGVTITRAADVRSGQRLQTTFIDGNIQSITE